MNAAFQTTVENGMEAIAENNASRIADEPSIVLAYSSLTDQQISAANDVMLNTAAFG